MLPHPEEADLAPEPPGGSDDGIVIEPPRAAVHSELWRQQFRRSIGPAVGVNTLDPELPIHQGSSARIDKGAPIR